MINSIKVLLVDDHSVVRIGCQTLLEKTSNISVIAQAASAKEAYDTYTSQLPDVVVLDLVMPSGFDGNESTNQAQVHGGLEAIRRIKTYDENAKILVLTGKDGDSFPNHVFQAGALGFVTKQDVDSELERAITEVFAGRQYIADTVRQQMKAANGDEMALLETLTKREFQIFSLLAEGQAAAAIANKICLSPKTVHAHRSKILRKLKVKGNSDLVHLAIRTGIVEA